MKLKQDRQEPCEEMDADELNIAINDVKLANVY